MSTEKPVRLTFPAYDVGAVRIIAGGKHEVGRIIADFWSWPARLWPQADMPTASLTELEAMEIVRYEKLRDARAGLRERVAEKGPWWTG